MEFLRKLSFLRRRDFDAGLSEEMQFHIEERADELERTGIARPEALRRARIEFGATARLAEDTRREWQWSWFEDLLSDLRYSARALRRDPAFFFAAVLSLALGIGVNTAIFSLTTETLMTIPSGRDPSTIGHARVGGGSHIGVPEFQFLRDAKVFPDMAGFREDGEINWRVGDETHRLFAMRVTGNFFDMVGVPLLMGRGIREGDTDTVVLSHRMWRSRLAGASDALGRSLILDGRPHTVVGILPEDHRTVFGFGLHPDLYAAVTDPKTNVILYLRLPEGASLAASRERLVQLAGRLDAHFPDPRNSYTNNVELDISTGYHRLGAEKGIALFFFMLMAVVTLLLAIACLNVSGLLLARASSRAQEFAIRASLGAGRVRILRQLLTESLLLAIAGTAAGLILNVVLTRILSGLDFNLPVPILLRIEPDWRLLAYASTIGLASAVLVGILPAWRASRSNASDALKQTEHQVGGRLNLRRVLVIAQVATSIVVLTTAGLFARNLLQSISASPGFDLDRILYVKLRLVPAAHPDVPTRTAMLNRAITELRAIPGVESVAATRLIPFNDDTTMGGGVHPDSSKETLHIPHHLNRVGPGYFHTIGVPVVAGREFGETGENEIIINETFARRAFGNVSPVGHTLRIEDRVRTVIGVVRDSKYAWMSDKDRAAAFERHAVQTGGGRNADLQLMVRAAVDPETLVRPIQRSMTGLDLSSAVEVKPMSRALGMALLPSRMGAGLLGLMGLLGLTLTAIGLYGLLAYSVARRIREIGLRVALGAAPGRVVRIVFGEGAWLVGLGLCLGLAAAFFITQPLTRYLVEGLSPSDPLTYGTVSVLMLLAGWTACALPARRALRIEPMEALRYE